MRTLHVTAELYPFINTGGLGDVSAALPPALILEGVDARLLMPSYPALAAAIPGADGEALDLGPALGASRVLLHSRRVPGSGVPIYLIDAPGLYDRPGNPYAGPDGADWPDNHLRFALLGWAAARIGEGADPDWRAEIVHGHDWHAGLAPAYLAAAGRPAASVFTIHNLAFQGLFPAADFPALGLPPGFFAVDGLEFWDQVSFMKAGLVFADRITTVSPSYAREIQTPAEGCGLDGLLAARAAALSGILNGVDPDVWDPAYDGAIAANFTFADLSGKARCKRALQLDAGLSPEAERPLFGVVTRLTRQKGMDLLLEALPDLLRGGGQFVLLGSGDRDIENAFAAAANPGNAAVRIGYDEAFARAIYAGSDVVLVPSRFEPCGLTQMYAMRYGALPLVRRVGGLADTVIDAGEPGGTGFLFEAPTGAALAGAIARAIRLYRDPDRWTASQRNAMAARFGWDRAARSYAAIYAELVKARA